MASSRAASNVIIGGVLLHLALGTLYSWGCIQPYVTSYIRWDTPGISAYRSTVVVLTCRAQIILQYTAVLQCPVLRRLLGTVVMVKAELYSLCSSASPPVGSQMLHGMRIIGK